MKKIKSIAIQADPIEPLKVKGDSTIALIEAALNAGIIVNVYEPKDLSFISQSSDVIAKARQVSFKSNTKLKHVKTAGEGLKFSSPVHLNLRTVNVVLVRQDPPFDLQYITCTHLLEHIQEEVLVLNDPKAIRDAPEKLLVTHYADLLPPTLITRDHDLAKRFAEEHEKVIIKPLYGNGGKLVFRTDKQDTNLKTFFELFDGLGREQYILQAFLPEVASGDKRIIVIDGEAEFALNRIPPEGNIRSNLALGGKGECIPLSDNDRMIVNRLKDHFQAKQSLLRRLGCDRPIPN
jgi:glutathione synthase